MKGRTRRKAGRFLPGVLIVMLGLIATGDARGQATGPTIEPVSDTVVCPAVKIGRLKLLQFDSIVTNTGGADLTITSARVVRGDTNEFGVSSETTFPITLKAGESGGVILEFQPIVNEAREAVLRIESNAENTPVLELLLVGLGALPTITGKDVDFGMVPKGETRDSIVRGIIWNDGPIPLLIEEISLQSDAFYITDPVSLPVSVNPGDSFDLHLVYEPFIAGLGAADSLVITSDALPSPLYLRVSANTTNSVATEMGSTGELRLIGPPQPGIVEGMLELEAGGTGEFRIVDGRGAVIYTRYLGWRAPGEHRLVWDGRSSAGVEQGAGFYYMQVIVGEEVFARKVILIR